MRIKFVVAKTLVLALPLTLIPVFASSAPKVTPGTKCKVQKKKIDYQNKTYTCVKSGKKLIWNKGVVTVKAEPLPVVTVTPTPTPSPSSSPLISPLQNKDEVSKKIDQLLIDSALNPSSTIPTLVFSFQGPTSSEIETKTKRSLINAIPVYEKLGFKVTDALVLVARDMDWLKKEFLKFNCNNNRPLPERPGFYYGSTCTDGNGAVTSVHWEAEKFSDGLDGLYFNHVLPHEYFHQIQEKMTTFGNADFPKWFWEGSAQFFTNQAWASWNNRYSYLDWYQHWWTALRPDFGRVACKNATISLMSDPSTPGVEGGCAYSKGQLIVEYLVSKYGLEKYRKLYSQNSTYGWNNFNIVFRNVTGDELASFYVEAEEFIKSRGW
jgi:hypothetical protein